MRQQKHVFLIIALIVIIQLWQRLSRIRANKSVKTSFSKITNTMGRRRNKNIYSGIETGLSLASKLYVGYNREKTHYTKIFIMKVMKQIIREMKRNSPKVFAKLQPKIFGGGSSFEGLRVGEGSDFDIDILLTLPKETNPKLIEGTIPGHVQLQLQTFSSLQNKEPELYREMSKFVDDQNYVLQTPLKSTLMQSIFDRTMNNSFPNGTITVSGTEVKIIINRNTGISPALTMNIENSEFSLEVDLVPCILLNKNHWPQNGFRSNPDFKINDFFLVPKKSKRDLPHIDRYFELSFQKHEREIIRNQQWMKPTIRIMKLIRDNFGHPVASYAIKTLFLLEHWTQLQKTPSNEIPELWTKSFGGCLIYMLKRYKERLTNGRIPSFWNPNNNLLENLNDQHIDKCKRGIEKMLADIENNPDEKTILKYLKH